MMGSVSGQAPYLRVRQAYCGIVRYLLGTNLQVEVFTLWLEKLLLSNIL